MTGDIHIGRGSKLRNLCPNAWEKSHKVAVFGREEAIRKFATIQPFRLQLLSKFWSLSGARQVCLCTPNQACHADSTIDLYSQLFPLAFDRNDPATGPPSSATLTYVTILRNEPEEDGFSSAAPQKGSGWRGQGEPMMVGSGCIAREITKFGITRAMARRHEAPSTLASLEFRVVQVHGLR